jgi:uncharacterized protein (TIGR02099 family)
MSMNPPPTTQAPLTLRWTAALTHALLWIVGGAWALFALTWGAIHAVIVPRIDTWRPQLEALATRGIGVPVRIGSIEARDQGLIPSFELRNVRLLDREGRDALVLQRVLTSLSVTSLWRLGFEQVVLDAPVLDIRRTADGRIELAGLDILQPRTPNENTHAAADWFFSQTELAVRGGEVNWTDEWRRQPTVKLDHVNLVLRNPGRQHLARLDAHWAEQPGQRISLRARMRSPLLTLHPGSWEQWNGTAYADLPAVNLAALSKVTDLPKPAEVDVQSGAAALRVWLDVSHGEVRSATADMALTHLQAVLTGATGPLALEHVDTRLTWQKQASGWDATAQHLNIRTPSGAQWRDSQLQFTQSTNAAPGQFQKTLLLEGLQLELVREVAQSLPWPQAWQQKLSSLQPEGVVKSVRFAWNDFTAEHPVYSAQGAVTSLALAAESPTDHSASATGTAPGRPGFSGAALEFQLTQDGGLAKLKMERGHLEFPGVFEEPTILLDKFMADARWTIKGDQIQVDLSHIQFANADVQGQAKASWHTLDKGPPSERFPGVLNLDGTLSRGAGDRVHRYLPLVLGADARHYVKDAILGGKVTQVQFHVAGPLLQLPFQNPQDGEFHVAARVSGVDYAFIPPSLSPAGQPRWPHFKGLEGELVFDRASMALNVSKGTVADAPGLQVLQAQARIDNLEHHSVVDVKARLDGPLSDALGVVKRSPLARMTSHALDQATGNGNAQVQLSLSVPLVDTDRTTVKGSVSLPGNDLQLSRDSPLLLRTRGQVEFSEQGFQVRQASTRMLGGELLFSGGMRTEAGAPVMQFRGQGVATADGLRQADFLRDMVALTRHSSGSAPYTAQLSWAQGMPELTVTSNLEGLGLDLPSPLNKPAAVPWGLSYTNRVQGPSGGKPATSAMLRDLQTFRIGMDNNPRLLFVRSRKVGTNDSNEAAVHVAVGQAAATEARPPPRGMTVSVDWPELDLDAWDLALSDALWPTSSASTPANTAPAIPDHVQIKAETLTAKGKTFHQAHLDAARKDGGWHARVDARELSGQLDYQEASGSASASLIARLDRLSLLSGNADEFAAQATNPASSQPNSIPALDVEVGALELDGRSLGQLSMKAVNRQLTGTAREWRLTQLSLRVPEAHLSATGNWADITSPPPLTAAATPATAPRRTVLAFKLDVQDSGALLARFGMPGVFRGGKGQLQGTVGWLGAPTRMDTHSMDGDIRIDIASGQFLKSDPGLAKLLGVLSLQTLPRRLTLDFSDVFSHGFAFDFIRGDARIEHGLATTNNLQMKGVNAAVLLEGKADIGQETQDIRALVVPEINAGTASLIATVINPAIGLGSFLAQAILRQPLIQASTQEFRIHGSWSDPQVDKVAPSSGTASPSGRSAPSALPPLSPNTPESSP